MKSLEIEASVQNLDQVLGFLEEQLFEAGCPMKTTMQLQLAAEELFVNIASYAYKPGTGNAVIQVEFEKAPRAVKVTFTDSGVPYDPLKKEDPDVTLCAAEREIGGLGIFITKKSVDDISYEYRDGENILTVKKYY